MSVHVSAWAWQQDLPPTRKLILVALADGVNDDGWRGWPPSEELIRKCCVGRGTFYAHVNALIESGLVEVLDATDAPWPQLLHVRVPWEGERP